MAPRQMTCAEIDRDDLDERYLAGRLSEPDAEAFEAHYFECERCWSAVSRSLEVRAAEGSRARAVAPAAPRATAGLGMARSGAATDVRESRRPARRHLRIPLAWGALAAAASLLVAVSLWRTPDVREPPAPDAARGAADTLQVVARVEGGAIHAAWPPAREADRYRARLLAANAALLLERETSDTAVSVPMSALGEWAGAASVYWDVQALDRLRRVTARSGLVAVPLTPRP